MDHCLHSIHGAFNSELEVDKSEDAFMCILRWGTRHFNPLLVSETLQPSFSSRHSPHLPLGSGGRSHQRAGDCQGRRAVADCGCNA